MKICLEGDVLLHVDKQDKVNGGWSLLFCECIYKTGAR